MHDSRAVPFVCPIDHGVLEAHGDWLVCVQCAQRYPVVGGKPVLLNEANSVFRIADYTGGNAYGGASAYGTAGDGSRGLKRLYHRIVYTLSESGAGPAAPFSASDAVAAVQAADPDAQILIIGAGETSYAGNITYTDVAFGKNVRCIADAHDLPFADGSFDLVVACAVLEHVADPARCVAEMWRVLKSDGRAYAETPFLQPVHMREYDFTRFTFLGHRRLFRFFDQIEAGISSGPGMSIAFVLRTTLANSTEHRALGAVLHLAGLVLSYPLRLLDHIFTRSNGAYDSASAHYFFGQKRETAIPDRDILQFYRGA
ncbi:methyltransferase domain-containing protein [Uliginosibacterium sp. sgz301328]|uniref:methyltransferase domain-containing protein n=1 Tax=Uliginosibacterium sp. sgz301328 TaxID=3243764 RepID=UPI00359CD0AA